MSRTNKDQQLVCGTGLDNGLLRWFSLADDAPEGPVTIRVELTERQSPRRAARPAPQPPEPPSLASSSGGTRAKRERWTGLEVRLLREAMRLDVTAAADLVGVTAGMWSAWETNGRDVSPPSLTQRALDKCLAMADAETRERFFAASALTKTPVLLIPVVVLSPHLKLGEAPLGQIRPKIRNSARTAAISRTASPTLRSTLACVITGVVGWSRLVPENSGSSQAISATVPVTAFTGGNPP